MSEQEHPIHRDNAGPGAGAGPETSTAGTGADGERDGDGTAVPAWTGSPSGSRTPSGPLPTAVHHTAGNLPPSGPAWQEARQTEATVVTGPKTGKRVGAGVFIACLVAAGAL